MKKELSEIELREEYRKQLVISGYTVREAQEYSQEVQLVKEK